MIASGFSNAPISRFIVLYIVGGAIAISLLDWKYYVYIQVVPHLWGYRQFWRLLTWQVCYTNSTEVLFAALSFYHLRVIERLWGSRKFASFLLSISLYTTLLPPLILALVLRPLSFNNINYLPAGPTPILFALLAQYHAAVPYVYKYRIAASSTSANSLTLTSKTVHYFLPIQLSLSQLPGSALAAAVGWAIGYAYRNETLPGANWRVPGWMLGEKKMAGEREGFEGLRRRLEGEASSSGVAGAPGQAPTRRRTLGDVVAEQFGGTG